MQDKNENKTNNFEELEPIQAPEKYNAQEILEKMIKYNYMYYLEAC